MIISYMWFCLNCHECWDEKHESLAGQHVRLTGHDVAWFVNHSSELGRGPREDV